MASLPRTRQRAPILNDDFLFPSEFPVLDPNGLLFSVPNGSFVNIYNIFGPGVPEPEPGYQLADNDSGGNPIFTGALTPDFTLTPAVATPEPSSLIPLGIGAAGLAAYRKRKRSQAPAAPVIRGTYRPPSGGLFFQDGAGRRGDPPYNQRRGMLTGSKLNTAFLHHGRQAIENSP